MDLPQYAVSTFQIKALDDDQRLIEGIASTPSPDRVGDVMEPAGAKYTLPMPLLWQHQKDKPIGHVVSAAVTAQGIKIKAQIARGIPYVDEVWSLIKARLVPGLSIGWRPLDLPEPIVTAGKTLGLRYKVWDWLELSAVTVPANRDTTITAIKSIDAAQRATFGPGGAATPGVPGQRRQDSSMDNVISDQIATAQADLQTKASRMADLMRQEDTDGGLTPDEVKERDGLTAAVDAATQRIARLKTLEAAQAAQASPLQYPAQPLLVPGIGHAQRPQPAIQVVNRAPLEKGQLFIRYAMAIGAGKGSYSDTLAFARQAWDATTPEVSQYIRATWGKAIAGTATVGTPAWGGELAYPNNLASEFVELLRAATVLGRIAGWRNVPFNVRVGVQTGGSTVGWVGEAAVKPVGELDFTEALLTYSKIAGIVVLSDELIRLSSPSAEGTVRTDLTNAITEFMDQQLVDPSVAAGANNPASLTNGVAAVPASGTDATAFYIDMNAALAAFDAANMGTDSLHVVTTPAVARGLATLRNALGGPEFPGATPNGGSVLGFPLIVSNSVPTGLVVLIKANEVWLADDGGVTLDASNQATLDMAGGASPTFNLWQRNCTGIRAERWVRWQKRRTAAVQLITGAAYAPTATT